MAAQSLLGSKMPRKTAFAVVVLSFVINTHGWSLSSSQQALSSWIRRRHEASLSLLAKKAHTDGERESYSEAGIEKISIGEDMWEYSPLFSFSDPQAVAKFDRIDDVIMGGISSSKLVKGSEDDNYVKWLGICRTDGGGFCGIRTLPFVEPLMVGDSDGFYLVCQMASDKEPERRVWKMTTRVKPDRGELLYQARYSFTQVDDEWSRVIVPFDSFKLVRGPRMIADGPPLNVENGIYQIGMTMSKFDMGMNVTEINNFRAGFFEMRIQEIGLYKKQSSKAESKAALPNVVLSKAEATNNRPLLLKLLAPFAKLFFTEKSQRRKSAMKILRTKRGLSRIGAIRFGLESRSRSYGLSNALFNTLSILTEDLFRSFLSIALRVCLIFPLQMLQRIRKLSQKNQSSKGAIG